MSINEAELVLDKARFARIVGESQAQDTATQLADAFSTQVAQIVDDISNLLDGEEFPERAVRGLLHRLRGSAEILGAGLLSDLTRSLLEHDQRTFNAAIKMTLPSLFETIDQTLAEIQTLARELKPRP